MPSRSPKGKRVEGCRVFVSPFFGLIWIFDGEVKRIWPGASGCMTFWATFSNIWLNTLFWNGDYTTCFPTRAATLPDTKKLLPQKTSSQTNLISRFIPFPLATFEMSVPFFGQLCTACGTRAVFSGDGPHGASRQFGGVAMGASAWRPGGAPSSVFIFTYFEVIETYI